MIRTCPCGRVAATGRGTCCACKGRHRSDLGYCRQLVGCIRSSPRVKRNRWEVTITGDWVLEQLQAQGWKCPLTGVTLSRPTGPAKNGGRPNSVSLDRIDPKKGYTPDNVRVVSHAVNMALGEMTDDEFAEMCIQYLRRWNARKKSRSG